MLKNLLIIFGIFAGLFLLIHNAYYYPYLGGYNSHQHIKYAKIISNEFRFPTYEESYENYNPPLFHLTAGLLAKLTSQLTGLNFYQSVNAYKVIGVLLAAGSIYFWYLIINCLYPFNKFLKLTFIVLVFSLPVFHKVAVMFNTELPLMFLYSLSFWYLLVKYFNKPSKKSIAVLALITSTALLVRISSITLFITFIFSIVGLWFLKKINLKKAILHLFIYLFIVFSLTGWFYIGRKDQGIYKAGRVSEPDIPIWKRQPIEFYTYIPFKFMMTYPIRLSTPLNHIIPIYYSEFWGDFWNYYSQRRFGISEQARYEDHYLTTPKRVANLALQNQINLPFTIIMILGFILLIYRFFKGLFYKKKSLIWLAEAVFLSVSLLTWFGFLLMNIKYPNWKSDAVKPSYMLNIIPIFIYTGVVFLFSNLKKIKFIFYPIMIWLVLSTLINLWWAYY